MPSDKFLETALVPPPAWTVTCLCAQWCGACREYRSVYDTLARRMPDVLFEWVDVEDQADRIGDLDVETFPTLLIAQGGSAVFLSPLPPHGDVLARLIDALRSAAPTPSAEPAAQALLQRLRAAVA